MGIKHLLFPLWEAPWWVLFPLFLLWETPWWVLFPLFPLWETPRWVYSSLFTPLGGTPVGIFLPVLPCGRHPGGYISPVLPPPSCGRHPGGYIPSVPPVGGTLVGIYPSLYTLVGTLLVYMPPCIPRVGSLPPVYMPAMLRTDLVHVNGLLGMTVLTRGLYLRGSSLRKRGKEAKRRFYARM